MDIRNFINKAIRDHSDIIIKYQKDDGSISTRKLSNIDYSDEFGNEYIKAFCHLRKEDRTFKISRILEINGVTFKKASLPNYWVHYGEEYSLRTIWAVTNPGQYEQIDGDVAYVIGVEFSDGSVSLRIEVPFKNGNSIELKLFKESDLEEGDAVPISTITGFEICKRGAEPIVRYDGNNDDYEYNGWEPYDDELCLKDIWNKTATGLFEKLMETLPM